MSPVEPAEYGEHDLQRLHPEAPKEAASAHPDDRTPFARDRARVLHSAALRRLAGKTQVLGPNEGGDVPRTRLTHSLEVAQIGRGIATALGADPDLVDTAGLAHDIGHPPFGHNGEDALDELAADHGGFEGNAQTLRILTRLEPKVTDVGEVGRGLNLTRACLDAAMKYPWPRRSGEPKFGVYDDDLEVFEWVRAGAPEGHRCLEAQIMDWADDVAYSVHDVEDAVISGRISLRTLTDPQERAQIAKLAGRRFPRAWDTAQLEEAAAELVRWPVVAAVLDYDGTMSAQVALKRLTSELVGRFVAAAVSGTVARFGSGLHRYRADLVLPEEAVAEVTVLKAMAVHYVFDDEERKQKLRQQRELLSELVEALTENAPASLDAAMRESWMRASDDSSRFRVILDQVASLTDAQAVTWHERHVHRVSKPL
ncbi:deoxyguanosinetriphosphate triphosphohydrolase [Saccharopolyspora rhizosphaerae]|uniref:Deoxyguanosinetriphosphate triphosphohydrolase-like protein n=1 Tax=Saccharopolyspora rhizosphaerae TaxID=2492662 RepID=A0A3R8Q8H1_9PSEU|nr:deoxyguanosinetriphosphate triphosphohydrolase [Saccharopolyspora rhizosphaerae]RRO19276.1 deoxyguanosinetriphosphate triphosphohydrolase [Saccharopolyspora rhizosphaerae]